MIPYSGLYFFYILVLALIPAVILGFAGKSVKLYGIIINMGFLVFIFGNSKSQYISLILYFFGEIFLISIYVVIRKRYNQRWLLWIVIICSLFPLFLTKWGHIFVSRQLGFLGISYLTFKVIQVLIEIYDGLIKKINIVDFAYFLLFFPTISSGPIDRWRRFEAEVNKSLSSSEYYECFKEGIWKIFNGLLYKFIIGYLIATFWMNKIPMDHKILSTVNYMYAYSLYLFFDFAGYSLMAIGISYLLGVKTPDNFNMPFLSTNIKDFWNRWHMSLSFWFRDFIYTRFVMASIKNKWFKSRFTASYIGYIITMTTMGIWHGTEIYYILYGFYHGILIVGTDYFQRKSKWYQKRKKSDFWNIIFVIITFNLICFGFLIFSGYLFKK